MRFRFTQFVDDLAKNESRKQAENAYADWTNEDLTEMFDERAAIFEYAGELPRIAAEQAALDWMKNEIGESRYEVWCSKPNNLQFEKVVADPARPTTVTTNCLRS